MKETDEVLKKQTKTKQVSISLETFEKLEEIKKKHGLSKIYAIETAIDKTFFDK